MVPNLKETESLLESVLNHTREYLGSAATHPASVKPVDETLSFEVLDQETPISGSPAETTLQQLIKAGTYGTQPTAAPNAFGFVIGGTLPIGMAADWLTTVWNQVASTYQTSPVASQAEAVCERWLVELLGLPPGTAMGLTSGCTSANLVGLAAAREHQLHRLGWDVNRRGLRGAPDLTVIVSEQTHASISRCLRLLGLGGDIRHARTDPEGRMDPESVLSLAGQAGGGVVIVGQVGATDGGSIDPIGDLAQVRDEVDAWLHLDAAFGMWAAASPRLRSLVHGMDRADSWATDAHKWLNCPYDSGMVFCAHPDVLTAAMEITARYLDNDDRGLRHPVNYRMEVSQRARALPLWATLHHLGREGIAQIVERNCDVAWHIAGRLGSEPGISILAPVRLNQILVHVGDEAFTREFAGRLAARNVAWATTTTWQDTPAVRISVSNWQTDTLTAHRVAEGFIHTFRALSEGGEDA